jgi:hypothetical protein
MNNTIVSETAKAVDSSIYTLEKIGLRASKSGNFRFARQVLLSAIKRVEEDYCQQKDSRWIELATNIADTYVSEGNSRLARSWYLKILERTGRLYGTTSPQAAVLMVRLAELAVLESNPEEYQSYFDLFTRAYLLWQEEDTSVLLDPLTDLSWALCVKGNVDSVQAVHSLISQINELQQDDERSASSTTAWGVPA